MLREESISIVWLGLAECIIEREDRDIKIGNGKSREKSV